MNLRRYSENGHFSIPSQPSYIQFILSLFFFLLLYHFMVIHLSALRYLSTLLKKIAELINIFIGFDTYAL